jgi:hypothetical protein
MINTETELSELLKYVRKAEHKIKSRNFVYAPRTSHLLGFTMAIYFRLYVDTTDKKYMWIWWANLRANGNEKR